MKIPETKSSLDIKSAIASLSIVTTEDGTTIINDPEYGSVSGATREAAEAEIRRRKSLEKAA